MAIARYMVVVERGETSCGAHVPDLPGCVAVGETRFLDTQIGVYHTQYGNATGG